MSLKTLYRDITMSNLTSRTVKQFFILLLSLCALSSLSVSALADTEDFASLRFLGAWELVVQETYNGCTFDPEHFEYETIVNYESETQVSIQGYDGRTYTGKVESDQAYFSQEGTEKDGGNFFVEFLIKLDASQSKFTGETYYIWNDGFEYCEVTASVSGTKTRTNLVFQTNTEDGKPIENVTVKLEIPGQEAYENKSDSDGFNYLSGEVGISLTATITKQGYTFEPSLLEINNLTKNLFYKVKATVVESEQDAQAIIIAGGGDPNDYLWEATNTAANFAYKSLLHKGITKQNIRYFNSQKNQDVDGDGIKGNDIFGTPTLQSLNSTLNDWIKPYVNAKKPLLIYMLDHGLPDKFFLRKPIKGDAEILTPSQLDGWLDELQNATNAKVIVIYDACFSGSFMDNLKATGSQQRILIFSSGTDELAYFGSRGDLSFSTFFWKHTIQGKEIRASFNDARRAIRSATNNSQGPVLDDSGDGKYDSHADGKLAEVTYIGNPLVSAAALPVITESTGDQSIGSASSREVYAKVNLDNNAIEKVWAVVVPPNTGSFGDQPIADLAEFKLDYNSSTRHYQGFVRGMNQPGTYKVSFYAKASDKSGFVSLPKTIQLMVSGGQACANESAILSLDTQIMHLFSTRIFTSHTASYDLADVGLKLVQEPNSSYVFIPAYVDQPNAQEACTVDPATFWTNGILAVPSVKMVSNGNVSYFDNLELNLIPHGNPFGFGFQIKSVKPR